jgi:hypothetical protein
MTDSGHIGEIERRVYLVDHFHVSYQSGSAWLCACSEFARSHGCRHTREAAGMRAAQANIRRHLARGGLPLGGGQDDAEVPCGARPSRRSDSALTTR